VGETLGEGSGVGVGVGSGTPLHVSTDDVHALMPVSAPPNVTVTLAVRIAP
jgi:hypothetical protein